MAYHDEIHGNAHKADVREQRTEAPQTRRNVAHHLVKKEAWEELHTLTSDWDSEVRLGLAQVLGYAFPHLPDKERAWNDLKLLTQDRNATVRNAAVESIGTAFPHIPDKKRTWRVLHWLIKDVRRSVAAAIGAAFPHIPDKEQALEDLNRLAKDKEKGVRIAANYSLGRISLLRASDARSGEIFISELEKALDLFEKSGGIASFFSPARFCLPFYRSFYTICLKKQDAETVIQRYLADMKLGISDLENKEELLEAAKKLARTLMEVQEARDFDKIKSDFNASRQYCEHAAGLIDTSRKIHKSYKDR